MNICRWCKYHTHFTRWYNSGDYCKLYTTMKTDTVQGGQVIDVLATCKARNPDGTCPGYEQKPARKPRPVRPTRLQRAVVWVRAWYQALAAAVERKEKK